MNETRVAAIKLLVGLGWSPPSPSTVAMHRILDDMEKVQPQATLDLQPAELRAVAFAAKGYTEREAAEFLEITPNSMHQQCRDARRKLKARSMAQAVDICYQRGWL